MRNAFGVSLVASACIVCMASASAQQAVKVEQYNFKVDAGPLSRVVAELATQARASAAVGFTAEVNVKANAVVGLYSLKDALDVALVGTGWKVQTNSDRTFKIVKEGSEITTLDMVVVTARRNDFVRTTSSMLTRTDTPLRQTPGTIDSVTEEVFETQNAISVFEAMRNIPGAIFNSTNGQNSVIIGQETAGDVTFTNGVQGSRVARNPPITDIESIEVLKGPASILAGASIASGAINYVPKRATGKSATDLSVSFGSGKERIVAADVGGAISKENGLYWRVAVLGQDADRVPNGGVDPRQRVVNPMLGYRGDSVSFDASYQYFNKRTPVLDSAAYDPATQSFKDYKGRLRSTAGDYVESSRLSYNLEVDLAWTDDYTVTLRNKGLYQEASYKGQFQFPYAYDYLGMGSMTLLLANIQRDRQISEYVDLYSKFKTGKVEHQLILAADVSESNTTRVTDQNVGFASDTSSPALLPLPFGKPGTLTTSRQYSLILQDQMNLGAFHALVGMRKTNYKATPYTWNAAGSRWVAGNAVAESDKFLVNAGLVYDINKSVSTYVSYNNGFSPTAADYQTSAGTTLPPTLRTQREIGIKAGLFEDRLTLNASAYRFKTDNSISADLSNPAFYVPGPGLKGSGYEVSMAGSISPTFKLLAGYTHSTSEKPSKTPVTGIPNNVANVWGVKTFRLGAKESIDAGLGGNYNSGFYAQSFVDGQYYEIDRKYLTLNASLGYTNGRYTINAFINNILDRRNYQPSTQIGQIQMDVPRSVRVDFRARF